MRAAIEQTPDIDWTGLVGIADRPRRGRTAAASLRAPVEIMPAGEAIPASCWPRPRWAFVAATLIVAAVSVLAAAELAAAPAPWRTQSLGGTPQVSGVVEDGRSDGALAFDTGAPSYRIDPATYEMTLPQQDVAAPRQPGAGIHWTTRWPMLWAASNGFVELVLTFGFATIGGIVLASLAEPDVDENRAGVTTS